MKVVFLIIYFWEVKTISQDKSMNLDGSLDDDDEDEKKSRTSLTFSVRHGLKALLAWRGHSYVVFSGHAETGKDLVHN